MQDFTDELRALRQRLTDAERYLDLEGQRKRLAGLEAEASRHQVRVEVADDHLPADPAEREELCDRLLGAVTEWAEACIADRHAEVSEL